MVFVCMFSLHLLGLVASVQLKTLFRSHQLCNGFAETHTFYTYFSRVCDVVFFYF